MRSRTHDKYSIFVVLKLERLESWWLTVENLFMCLFQDEAVCPMDEWNLYWSSSTEDTARGWAFRLQLLRRYHRQPRHHLDYSEHSTYRQGHDKQPHAISAPLETIPFHLESRQGHWRDLFLSAWIAILWFVSRLLFLSFFVLLKNHRHVLALHVIWPWPFSYRTIGLAFLGAEYIILSGVAFRSPRCHGKQNNCGFGKPDLSFLLVVYSNCFSISHRFRVIIGFVNNGCSYLVPSQIPQDGQVSTRLQKGAFLARKRAFWMTMLNDLDRPVNLCRRWKSV